MLRILSAVNSKTSNLSIFPAKSNKHPRYDVRLVCRTL